MHCIDEGFGIRVGVEMQINKDQGYNGYEVAGAITGDLSGCCKFIIYAGEDGKCVLLPIYFFMGIANLVLSTFAWGKETPPDEQARFTVTVRATPGGRVSGDAHP